MVPNGEQAGGSELKELPPVERSVLRALCLTINLAGSVVKDRILDTLTKDHFRFPINRALFAALRELHHRGEYVVLSNLEDELRRVSVKIPADLSLGDLFRGDPPRSAEVGEWVDRLKEGKAPSAHSARADLAPAAAGRAEETPAPGRENGLTRIRPVPEVRGTGAEMEKQPKARPARTEVAEGKPRPPAFSVLSSEGEEWTNYLQEVAAKQGKIFETGLTGLDETAGGLSPGLMLLVDRDSSRLSGFLKQLVDQIAARSRVPCLYLSFALPKAALRVRTLARLSGVPARDIERGRIRKGSPEWESVERNGRAAAEWLKWIFVVDADAGVSVDQVLEMGRQLLASQGAPACLVVLDSLDKMPMAGESPQSIIASLQLLSESLDALVIAASANKALLAEPGVNICGTLGEEGGAVRLEIIRADDPRLSAIRFEYRPDIHRFTEQPAS